MTDKSPLSIKLPAPVADIYRAVAELERLYPGRKFTPDGHLVGSIGEVIAAEHFGLTLHSMSKAAHDAVDADGNEVQIKLTAGNSVSMFADCERLMALRCGRRLARSRRTRRKNTSRMAATLATLDLRCS